MHSPITAICLFQAVARRTDHPRMCAPFAAQLRRPTKLRLSRHIGDVPAWCPDPRGAPSIFSHAGGLVTPSSVVVRGSGVQGPACAFPVRHTCAVAEKVLPTVTSSLVAQTCCWWGVMTVLSATFASLLSGAPPLPCDYATLSRRALDQLTMNRGS